MDTTTIYNKRINLNCTFDGSSIIYLAGSNIVYVFLWVMQHNVFQNIKHFQQRVNDYQVLAMAVQRNADISIALVTKVPGV